MIFIASFCRPRGLGIRIIIAQLILLFSAVGAQSRTWHVRVDGTGDVPTIQAAIDSSAAGDAILVAPGVYEQGCLIIHKDSITVVGEGGPGNTILRTLTTQILGVTRSKYVVVRGFTLENCLSYPLIVDYSNNILVENNVFRFAGAAAILLWCSFDIAVRDNLIYSNAYGVLCTDLCSSIDVEQNTISHNSSGTGLDFGDTYLCYARNNIIAYNQRGVYAAAAQFLCNDVVGNGVNYQLVFGSDPTGTNGNISAAPLFCGADPQASGNYYLQQGSPCAPGNHPVGYPCGVIGRYPVGCGSTSVERATWGEVKSLFR